MGPFAHTLRLKILKSVLLTVVLPAFVLLISFYVAWNAFVRGRIGVDIARSTQTLASRIESDLNAYDDLLNRLAVERGVMDSSTDIMGEIYATLKERRVKAVISGVLADGHLRFCTMGRSIGADEEALEPDWGLYGLMNREPRSVVGYQRSRRFGATVQTDYSLGIAVEGASARAGGYLTADISFRDWQELSSERSEGVTGRFILTNEFDRVVATYDGSPIHPFERFTIPGKQGEAMLGGATYAFARREVGSHRLSVYGLTSIQFIITSFRFGLYTIGVILVLFSLVFAVVLSRSVARMTRPMHDILTTMGKVSQGDFTARLDVISGDEFEEIAVRLNALIVEMESTVDRLMERIELAKTAEMKQLQAQFNPHFLYNTIDTAKWMMRMGETEKASIMLTSMAKVLRYSVRDRPAESMISLREDLEIIRTYLEIHRLSLGDKLKIDYDIDDAATACRIPKLLIQPLVENALIHGIGSTGEGKIGITIRSVGDMVAIRISDSGKGFSLAPEELTRLEAAEGGSDSSMGMSLVLRRARLHYGDRFSFEIGRQAGSGTVVTLSIPRSPERA